MKNTKKIISLILAFMFICLASVSCGSSYSMYNYRLSDYVELPEYKNLPVTSPKFEVTEDDIDNQILGTVNYYARKIEVTDRGAIEGDVVTVDYSGFVEGISEQPITLTNIDIVAGMGKYPEEFESALIGMTAGESKYIEITLPEEFPEYPTYAGKVAEIIVTVNAVCEMEAPELTDDFVRAYLSHDSVEEYRQATRDALEKQQKHSFYMIASEQTWGKIMSEVTVKKYPDAEVKFYYDKFVNSVREYVDTLELDFSAFVKTNFEMTEDEFYDYSMEQAENIVKEELVVNAIARNEHIKVTDTIYAERALTLAKDSYGLESVEELEEKFSREEIEQSILSDLVKEFIADNAVVTYSEKSEG